MHRLTIVEIGPILSLCINDMPGVPAPVHCPPRMNVRKEDQNCTFAYTIILGVQNLKTHAAKYQFAQEFAKSENLTIAEKGDIGIYGGQVWLSVTMTGLRANQIRRAPRVFY
jgi:hypothetical protein